MSNDVQARVSFTAEQVVGDYCTGDFPIDPAIISNNLGIPIKQVEFKALDNNTVSGGIMKQGEEICIYVNKNDSMNRKRFTIAHELGHYFLGHLDNKGEFVDLHRETKGSQNSEEEDANEFAGSLLMPKEAIKTNYSLLKSMKFEQNLIIYKLANIFLVSEAAIRTRLRKLNLE